MGGFREWLNLIETDVFQHLRSLVPSWPEYVIQDYLVKGFTEHPENAEKFLAETFPAIFGVRADKVKWTYKPLKITLDVFEPNTREILEQSMAGVQMKGAKDDQARHDYQVTALKDGPSKEPIILASTSQGFYLLEGRHRTTQSLKNWPKGYTQNTWFFKAKTLKLF